MLHVLTILSYFLQIFFLLRVVDIQCQFFCQKSHVDSVCKLKIRIVLVAGYTVEAWFVVFIEWTSFSFVFFDFRGVYILIIFQDWLKNDVSDLI